MIKGFAKLARQAWGGFAALLAGALRPVMSNRGLITLALGAVILLGLGPWLRPSLSRDIRGVHIPWGDSASAEFMPNMIAQAPRAWRWDSVAVPLLVVAGAGIPLVWLRRQWTNTVFGLLLLLALPALAVAMWNHPGLIEFLQTEQETRPMVRTMLRHQHDDLMTVRAPDRLAVFGSSKPGRPQYREAPPHPMVAALDFLVYPAWLLALLLSCLWATTAGNWTRRLSVAARFAGAGVVLALAVTWPRWAAERHWARADMWERTNQFAAAEEELELARQSMRCLGETRRYWFARGRIDTRQRESTPFSAFFVASQHFANNDALRAQAELAPYAEAPDASVAQRDLMAEIMGQIGVGHMQHGDSAGSRMAWRDAAAMAPWKPFAWVSLAAAQLAEKPSLAPQLHDELMGRLVEVGDIFIGSDIASMLGDAYFEIGEFERARAMYSEARRLFDLPKYVNIHAQEGQLGM